MDRYKTFDLTDRIIGPDQSTRMIGNIKKVKRFDLHLRLMTDIFARRTFL